jgi:KaiC/GvpD/RAD55 family RecA-like ATPase
MTKLNLKFEPLDSVELLQNINPFSDHSTNLLTVQPINQWIEEAKLIKVPARLFGDFWFEGEITILFASAGVGKTILAYQIADGISYGEQIIIFNSELPAQIVLYCDFEMSAKQVESRYSNNYNDHYTFSPNFNRVEINTNAEIPVGSAFEEQIIAEIEKALLRTGARILIVDNITFFKDQQEKAKDALKLMKQLKNLKMRLNLSILVLAHTPKRDITRPITRNDIAGSSMLVNFTDSAFTIGESALDVNTRYLKQIKPGRFKSTTFDAKNVMVCTIQNPNNFTRFDFNEFGDESDHLKNKADKKDLYETVLMHHKQGLSLREIGELVSLSHTQVAKIIKTNENQG